MNYFLAFGCFVVCVCASLGMAACEIDILTMKGLSDLALKGSIAMVIAYKLGGMLLGFFFGSVGFGEIFRKPLIMIALLCFIALALGNGVAEIAIHRAAIEATRTHQQLNNEEELQSAILEKKSIEDGILSAPKGRISELNQLISELRNNQVVTENEVIIGVSEKNKKDAQIISLIKYAITPLLASLSIFFASYGTIYYFRRTMSVSHESEHVYEPVNLERFV